MSHAPRWNWQQLDWPNFTFDAAVIAPLEQQYLQLSAEFCGTLKHISAKQKHRLVVYFLSQEAVGTSSIEGEVLSRESVQSSLQQRLGLSTQPSRATPQEAGIAALMTELFINFAQPLDNHELHHWHKLLSHERTDLQSVGDYRTSAEEMQIVSGPYGKRRVHFVAPPAATLPAEMQQFIDWFNASDDELPPLTRAALAHLHFVCLHPYEDGNGRIARALVEKSLSQHRKTPALLNLSRTILQHRGQYYEALARNNRKLDVTDWLRYLGETIVTAQRATLRRVELTIAKTQLYDTHAAALNPRQIKVIEKLFAAEPEGFTGGLSADNYLKITATSRATATRDLQQLVRLGILRRTGERRHTRYWLQIDE